MTSGSAASAASSDLGRREWLAIAPRALRPRVTRVLLLAVAVPSCAAAIDALSAPRIPGASSAAPLVLRVAAFALAAMSLIWSASPQGMPRRWPDDSASSMRSRILRPPVQPHAAFTAGVLAASALVLGLPISAQPVALVAFGVMVEELIFRRELPRALESVLNVSGRKPARWSNASAAAGRVSAVLLAQAAFAGAHLAVRGHAAGFGPGLPALRLFASGVLLAVLYKRTGLAGPIILHFVLNEALWSGRFGDFVPPTGGRVLVWSAGAVLLLVIDEAHRGTLGGGREGRSW